MNPDRNMADNLKRSIEMRANSSDTSNPAVLSLFNLADGLNANVVKSTSHLSPFMAGLVCFLKTSD
jgi:hypothetical protein